MDIAASIQEVTEEVVLRLARTLQRETGEENLCLAGGVALNCVANGRVLREGPFEDIWIQPAAGDAGGALGAAAIGLASNTTAKPRAVNGHDRMRGGYLGPRFGAAEIRAQLDAFGARVRGARRTRTLLAQPGRAARRGARRRLVPGPHGVRPARARRPLDHRRPAQREDAVGDEPQDQVPRVVPAVRAVGARGTRRRLLRARRARAPTC